MCLVWRKAQANSLLALGFFLEIRQVRVSWELVLIQLTAAWLVGLVHLIHWEPPLWNLLLLEKESIGFFLLLCTSRLLALKLDVQIHLWILFSDM